MDKSKIDRILRIVCIVLMVVCLLASGFVYYQLYEFRQIMSTHSDNRGDYENIIELMEEIEYIYNKNYIGETPSREQLEDMALLGFTAGYADKYGAYLSPTDSQKMFDKRQEKLVGIGVEVVYEEGAGYYISKVYENSPAQQSGIEPGTYLTSADGTEVTDENMGSFINLVRGEAGTTVKVGITSDNGVEYKDITRQDVRTTSVIDTMIGDIPYLHIGSFTAYTDEEFIETVDKYLNNGHKEFIVDLRNNTGGAADSVIRILDYILPRGLIVEFRGPEVEQTYISDVNSIDAKFAVLVNGNTASASELFSKVLQEQGYATIIGETTYGKGTVLSTYSLSNGGSLTLSTAKYYTDSNEDIEGVGVKPDIEVELPIEDQIILYKLPYQDDEQLQTAVEVVKNWQENK